MGVVYGAGSLWNWILRPGEPGHQDWTVARGRAWSDALEFEGSRYVGLVGKILNQYPTFGMEPSWRTAPARRGLLVPGKLVVLYLGNGGNVWFPEVAALPRRYRVYDPRTGEVLVEASLDEDLEGFHALQTDAGEPRVIVFFNQEQ
jgi:hypothetical protein